MKPADHFDDHLVDALRDNPRATVVELATRLVAPRALVSAQLRRLLETKAVRVTAIVHPSFSGLAFIGHVSISASGPVREFAHTLAEWDECVLVSIVSGEYDLIAEVRVADQAAMQDLLTRMRDHPNVTRVNTVIYARVVKGMLEHRPFVPLEIDQTDRFILEHLEHDGRLSWKDLSEKVEKSPSAVRQRTMRILDAGLARIVVVQQRGFGGGTVFAGAGLNLHVDATEILMRLLDRPEVEFAVTTVGRFDAILTLRGTSPQDIDQALDNLRSRAGVAGVESWFHLRSVKEDYSRRAYPTD